MNTIGPSGLKANLAYAENRLAAHKADEIDLILAVDMVKNQIRDLDPEGRLALFQSVFEEENFIDAVWFLQDEPEIKSEAFNFLYYKELIERKVIDMGVKIQ